MRREFPIGIPGLVPSQLSPPLVQLPAADGGDILGPSLNGAIAVNNGVPAGYVDNQPSDWQGKMWALGVASGGGVGHFSAFTPQGFWRADPGDITAPLLGGRSTVLSRNERRFFRGATGYAACVALAGDITPPPELSVMEFSYAGKSVRCPLDATPSALCPEAGHPEVAEIIDSALMDESMAEFIPDENNIVATLTVRAWRFGNRANEGAAVLEQIRGEAEHAEVAIIGVGATLPNFGVTARELTSNISEAVYEVSIAQPPPPGGGGERLAGRAPPPWTGGETADENPPRRAPAVEGLGDSAAPRARRIRARRRPAGGGPARLVDWNRLCRTNPHHQRR